MTDIVLGDVNTSIDWMSYRLMYLITSPLIMHVSLSAQKRNGDGFENEYKATCKIYLFWTKMNGYLAGVSH